MTTNTSLRRAHLVGAALALALVACSAEASETTTTSSPQATTTTTTAATPVAAAPQDLLESFAGFWSAGDWDGMAGVAGPDVVTIAQEAGQADYANVVWVPGCELNSAGTGSCELLYQAVGGEGFALIYSARYAAGADGTLTIAELVWTGDAG